MTFHNMNYVKFLVFFFILASQSDISADALAADSAAKQKLPNIVIIFADDLGYGDPGCYNDQSKIPTPNIDKLAKQGLRFTDAHTCSSVCTPSRYGLLTGRYSWRTWLKRGIVWQWDSALIQADRLTLPKMLQKNGYHTACVGKWHLGWDWPTKDGKYLSDQLKGKRVTPKGRFTLGKQIDFSRKIRSGPTTRGFDYYFGDDVPNFPPYCFIENDKTIGIPTEAKPPKMFGAPGPALPGWNLSAVMPQLTQRACRYIQQQKKSTEPFFLYMPLTAPHTPIAPAPYFRGKSKAGAYGDFVHEVDWTVGQVLKTLQRCGFADNTLVIFTSDNGSPQRNGANMSGPTGSVKKDTGHDPSRPWRGMKADIWEAGHRVPFIARWPGKIEEGKSTTEPIILTDLMRTIAGIVGQKLPNNAAEDSFDIGPVLFGKKFSKPIHSHLIHHSLNGTFAIRRSNWKLILGKSSGGFTRFKPDKDAPAGQLYHLKDDPSEKKNLYTQKPEIVKELTALLEKSKADGRTAK